MNNEPKELDEITGKIKKYYVKITCNNKEQVREIVSLLEKNNIEKGIITISG